MKTIAKLAIFFSIILSVVSCVSVTTVPVGEKNYPPHSNEIIFFEKEEDIDREYEKISIIMAKTTDADFVSDTRMMNGIKSKAQSIGADAVVFRDESYSAGYLEDTKTFRMLAVKFVD